MEAEIYDFNFFGMELLVVKAKKVPRILLTTGQFAQLPVLSETLTYGQPCSQGVFPDLKMKLAYGISVNHFLFALLLILLLVISD